MYVSFNKISFEKLIGMHRLNINYIQINSNLS